LAEKLKEGMSAGEAAPRNVVVRDEPVMLLNTGHTFHSLEEIE
jgi:hypothetical protein